MFRPHPFQARQKPDLTLPLSLSFQTTCALLKMEDLQPVDLTQLAHSSEKHGGCTHFFPKRKSSRQGLRGFRGLTLFFSRQQAGSNRRRERSTPDPGETYVELAEGRTQIDGHPQSVTHREGMRRCRGIRRKMVDAPCQHRPHAYDGEKKHQREQKEYVAQRHHVRRTGRPGTGFHAPHCNHPVT
jgi:hypothetical protein